MKVLWLTNIPSPYRLAFFKELSKSIDLTVVFETDSSTERDDAWKDHSFDGYRGVVLSGIRIRRDSAFSLKVFPYLFDRSYDRIVVTNFLTPMGMMATTILKIIGRDYIIESDGGFAREESCFKRKVKSFFMKGARMYLSTGAAHDDYYGSYGVNKQHIHRYPFSSVMQETILSEPVGQMEKLAIRKWLGVAEKQVVLFVGQMIYRKGVDILLEAAKKFDGEVGFYLVGGDPTAEYAKFISDNSISNVHFVKFATGKDMEQYYRMADIFLLPTREDIWGLVINEAMAYGLPVITTQRCLAGLELIEDGVNGCLLKNNTPDEISKAIYDLLANDAKCHDMAVNNLRKIMQHTIESMVKRHQLLLEEKGV